MKMRIFVTILGLLYAMPTFAYDTVLAERFAQFYEPFAGKTCAKSLQMIKSEDFVQAVRGEKKPFVLDVRTEQESAIYGITLADSVSVPMKEVFTKETLDQLPKCNGPKKGLICSYKPGLGCWMMIWMGCSETGTRSFALNQPVRRVTAIDPPGFWCPPNSEIALTVIDELQGKGIGKVLFNQLIDRTRALGVRHLDVTVLAQNTRVSNLLQKNRLTDRSNY